MLIEFNIYVKLSRLHRLFTALIVIFSMLLMQLAVASYVCPGQMKNRATNALSGDIGSATMVDCTGMDKEQPALCHAHAEDTYAKQSLDKPQSLDVPPFVLAGFTLTLQVMDMAGLRQDHQPPFSYLISSSAPPIAIRNCCFRI